MTAPGEEENVLFVCTGVTDFIGSQVTAELLSAAPQARIVALVPDSPAHARRRITAALHSTGRPLNTAHLARVKPIRANLADPRLGLDDRVHAALASRADTICHLAEHHDPGPLALSNQEAAVTHLGNLLILAAAARPHARFLALSAAGGRTPPTDARVPAPFRPGPVPGSAANPSPQDSLERLVRGYSGLTGRPASFVYCTTLITNRPQPPTGPQHPLGFLTQRVARLQQLNRSGPRHLFSPENPTTVRIGTPPETYVNLLQADHAARALVRLATAPRAPDHEVGTTTVFLEHPKPTNLRDLLGAVCAHLPGLRVTLNPVLEQPTAFEKLLAGILSAASLPLGTPDGRTGPLQAPNAFPRPPDITRTYLKQALRPPELPAPAHRPGPAPPVRPGRGPGRRTASLRGGLS
ncbi:SDR family oxidoreductase [Streptomyces sp. NPDC045456]|uniref:SDR family oxidoreductase n=1 Tax=Streptomyces sp. NPDC045456 TaxID=3155254 RepID=UPI0033EFF4D5